MSNSTQSNSKIKLDEIIVPENILNTIPKANKVSEHLRYYIENHRLKKPIKLTPNNKLRDGYVSLLTAKSVGLEEVEVEYV